MLALSPLPHHQRRPGPCEQVFLCRVVEGYYRNFHISARYNQNVTREALSQALRKVILKRPFLAVNFFRDEGHSPAEDFKTSGKHFMIKPLAEMAFLDVVEYFKWDGDISEAFFEHLDKIRMPVETKQPAWRLLVFDMDGFQTIVFLNNHSLLDGMSGANFHDDLVHELAQMGPDPAFSENLFSYKQDSAQLPPLMPPCEKFTDIRSVTTLCFIRTACSVYLPQWLQKLCTSITPGAPNLFKNPIFRYMPSVAGVPTFYKLVHFTPAETKRIVEYTRRNGYTLTPLVTAVALSALQKEVYLLVSSSTVFSSMVYVITEGRRYFPQYKEELKYGLHMAQNQHTLKPLSTRTEDILAQAMSISRRLKKSLATRDDFRRIGMLKYTNTWNLNRDVVNTTKGRAILEVSNLGLQTIEHGLWRVEDMFFGQSTSCFDHIGMSFISTRAGGLHICFQYQPEYEALVAKNGEGAMGRVAESFKQRVLDIVGV